VTGRASHRRRLAVLAVLAAARGRPVARERIVGYLWPEHPTDAARRLLTESVYVLRKELGEDAVLAAGDELSLNGARVASDVGEFDAALAGDDPLRAVEVYGGAFLEGFYVSDAPEFERWAEGERDRLARDYGRALETLAEEREAGGDPRGAAEWWRRLARHDPYSSRVALRLMRALEGAGEHAAAFRHAAAHAALLRDELGAEPDPEVEGYAARLRESPVPTPPSPRAAPAPAPVWPAGSGSSGGIQDGASEPASSSSADHALPAAETTDAPPTAPTARPRFFGLPRRVAIAGAFLAVAALLVVLAQRPSTADVDSSLYVVFPFQRQRGTVQEAGLTPGQAEMLMHDALAGWRDLRLVSAQQVHDVIARRGTPTTLSEARRLARELGAGRLLWGDLTVVGDSVMLRAGVYGVARSQVEVPERTVRISPDLHDAPLEMRWLAERLLTGSGAAGGGAGGLGTRSLKAFEAFQRGWTALLQWQLDRARAELTEAVTVDPGYARAHLWLAQAMSLGGDDPEEWRVSAQRAEAGVRTLPAGEQPMARALAALADARYPDACGWYEKMLARDSTDFAAWFGIGECNRLDRTVVPDPASTSGWRFRGSSHRAVEAYARALQTVPSSHAVFRGAGLQRLSRMLATEPRTLRSGWGRQGADSTLFVAYPSLDGDTLAYVPHTRDDFAAFKPATLPATRSDAIRRNRLRMREVTRSWARAFPASPDAHEAFALALELSGELDRPRQGQPSAPSELASARGLAREPDQRLRLAVMDVRLSLKAMRWENAQALADSILENTTPRGPHDAQRLAPLAALLGRVHEARELLEAATPEQSITSPRGERVPLPSQVRDSYADLLLYASLGLTDEARVAEARTERLVESWVEPELREPARTTLLNIPRRLAITAGTARERRPPLVHPERLVAARQALAAGDEAGARARIDTLHAARGDRRAGDVAIDLILPEAELHLALGDTAIAAAATPRRRGRSRGGAGP
jgi:DNA-binding SARP family transcriptional activator/tetratricopeptide (TPR) repeat protein